MLYKIFQIPNTGAEGEKVGGRNGSESELTFFLHLCGGQAAKIIWQVTRANLIAWDEQHHMFPNETKEFRQCFYLRLCRRRFFCSRGLACSSSAHPLSHTRFCASFDSPSSFGNLTIWHMPRHQPSASDKTSSEVPTTWENQAVRNFCANHVYHKAAFEKLRTALLCLLLLTICFSLSAELMNIERVWSS